MNLPRTSLFNKQPACPTSQMLVLYERGALASHQHDWISEHVLGCDFCGAELQLLSEHVPAEEEECPVTEIPLSLRLLAESVLSSESAELESFEDPNLEPEGLSLTDA